MESPRNLIEEYLSEIANKLPGNIGTSERDFLREIRTHLEEEIAKLEDPSAAGVLNVLERFGAPEVIAGDFSGGDDLEGHRQQSQPPVWLVVGLTVLVWPVGIVLAWVSTAWRTRDKVIATAIPLLALSVFLVGSVATYTGFTVVTSEIHEVGMPAPTPGPEPTRGPSLLPILGVLMTVMFVGSPLFSGLYLALQVMD